MTVLRPNRAVFASASLAAVLLAGCSGTGGIKSASAQMPQGALPGEATMDAKLAKSLAKAEAAVAQAPEDAAARAALGQTYLAAGRFVSAATALNDAMALGDSSGRTALGLALASLGMGQPRQSVAILDEYRADIPASDLGLALALSGETARGVAVLADALRGGESTAKVRQNLAYAYALDGRWTEAKLMAAQDVPADQLDKRLAFWALSMLPDRNVERVAALIGAPARVRDPGLPTALALNTAAAAAPQLAVAEPAPAPEPAPAAQAELAPVAAAPSALETNMRVQQMPAPQPAAKHIAVSAAPAPARTRVAAAVAAPRRPRSPVMVVPAKAAAGSGHFVQLGAFSSQQGAKRAWSFYTRRDPGLAAYAMTITPATIKGKQLWRVAAGGLPARGAAASLCSQLKATGGACFAYSAPAAAAPRAPAPMLAASGPQRARR